MSPPALQEVYAAWIDIGQRKDLGAGKDGHRFRVDILGGHFEGPSLRGVVLAGGSDRQCLRADGVKLLDALYDMQTHDGTVLTVRNRVILDVTTPGGSYARSVVQVSAPVGPYDWLNRRVLVGTLQSQRPVADAVVVTVYQVL